MPGPLRELTTVEELERAIDASATRPVVLFKHSRTCGTSAMAYDELLAIEHAPMAADLFLVVVQASRALSNAIEARFGIRHESPQVLVVRDGRVVWHASHFRVSAEAIQRAVGQVATTDATARPS